MASVRVFEQKQGGERERERVRESEREKRDRRVAQKVSYAEERDKTKKNLFPTP